MIDFLIGIPKFIGIILCVLLVFNFIIVVHEWGHFLAARWRGLKIEKFQIWMGKTIWKRTWNGVQYGLGTIPLGGFVQLPQMAPMGAIEGKSGEDREKLPEIKPLDKIIVAFAGPLFSLLLAFLFACGVAWAGKPVRPEETKAVVGTVTMGDPADKAGIKPGDTILEIDGKVVHRFFGLTDNVMWATASGTSDDVQVKVQRPGEPEPRMITVHAPLSKQKDYIEWQEGQGWWDKLFSRPPLRRIGVGPVIEGKVKSVEKNSPAELAGLRKGDVLLTMNGEKIYSIQAVGDVARKKPNEPMKLTVLRDGKEVETILTPRVPEKGSSFALTGISEFEELEKDKVYTHPSPFTLVADCFRNTFATFKALLAPKSSIGVSQMSGPVGIMNLYYNIFQNPEWWRLVLWFSVILNVGLAIFNMLPLPVLDGGHITMALLEMLRGKAIGAKLMEYVQLVCVLCLLSFVLFVTFKDVGSLGDKDVKVEWAAPPPAAK